MPKFYLNLGYKLKKKALCYSHLNNTVDILDRNIVMDYFRHENHWQSSQKKKNNNKTIYYIIKYCIFAFENIKSLHKTQEGYIKINAEKVHLNIQIIFKVLIFYYLLPFT
jgi:nitrous oxide reductase